MAEEQDIPDPQPEDEAKGKTGQKDLSIPQSETQPTNMEVHHHPELHYKRVHFKEYFLEFFDDIAVTMGFFAENIREHLAEGQREKEYINSLVKDLEYDT